MSRKNNRLCRAAGRCNASDPQCALSQCGERKHVAPSPALRKRFAPRARLGTLTARNRRHRSRADMPASAGCGEAPVRRYDRREKGARNPYQEMSASGPDAAEREGSIAASCNPRVGDVPGRSPAHWQGHAWRKGVRCGEAAASPCRTKKAKNPLDLQVAWVLIYGVLRKTAGRGTESRAGDAVRKRLGCSRLACLWGPGSLRTIPSGLP